MKMCCRCAIAATALAIPAHAAAAPCPSSFSEALAQAKDARKLSTVEAEFETEHELEAGNHTVLERPVTQIFLYDSLGGGRISYVLGGDAIDAPAALSEAYGEAAQCNGPTCVFGGSASGDLEEAEIRTSYRALTKDGDRTIQQPTLVCSFRE